MAGRLIGRAEEISALQSRLDETGQGLGCAVVLSGESGIGKTRLIDELKERAGGAGYCVLSGQCLPGISPAFSSVASALRSGGFESLVEDKAPRVVCAYLTNSGGLMLSKREREKSGLDADIFTSMLAAVNSFVQDSLQMLKSGERQASLNRLGYGNYNIVIESVPGIHLAVIIEGAENEFLLQEMQDILDEVRSSYGAIIEKWTGDVSQVKATEQIIGRLIDSGKYDGIGFTADNPKLRQSLIMDNITRGIVRISGEKPLLFVLDDLQWADSSSLALLHYMSRNIRSSRVLVVGAYRTEDIASAGGGTHPLAETLRNMGREELFKKMELRRLSEADIGALIAEQLGRAGLPADLTGRIYRESEGNPLFVLEFLRLVELEGAIARKDGEWAVVKVEGLQVPSKIYDLVARRLAGIPKDLRDLLDCASVIGIEFGSAALEPIAGLDKIRLLKALKELEAAYKIIVPRGGGYAFDHSKMREIIYFEIPIELRREYHRLVGEHMEKAAPLTPATAPVIAHHFSSAHDAPRAVRYLRIAAQNAKDSYANKEAISFYQQLLGFCDETGDLNGRRDALANLAEVYSLIGEYENAIESYRLIIDTTIPNDDWPRISEFSRKMATAMFKKGAYDDAGAAFTRALEAMRQRGESLELARVYLDMAWVAGERRDYETALRHSTRAMLILERFPDAKKELAQLYNSLYIVSYRKNDAENVMKFAQKSLEIREQLDDKQGIASAMNAIGISHKLKGDLDCAREWYMKSLAINEKIGYVMGIGNTYQNIGTLENQIGKMDSAINWFMKSLDIFNRLGEQYAIADSCHNIAGIFLRKEEWGKALEWSARNLYVREKLGDRQGIARSYLHLAQIFQQQCAFEKALKYLENTLEMALKLPDKVLLANTYIAMAECSLGAHDFPNSLANAYKSIELARQIGHESLECQGYRVLGLAHSAIGNLEESEKNLKKSIEICRSSEPELGKSYYEYGHFLLRGNDQKGLDFIEKSIQIFEKHGLAIDVKKARAALEKAAAAAT